MPKRIVKRASEILKQLESDNAQVGQDVSSSGGSDGRQSCSSLPKPASAGRKSEGMQLSFFQLDDPVLCQIRDEIIGLDINNLMPIEALNKLNGIKKILQGR